MREVLKSMREVLKSRREFLKSIHEVSKADARIDRHPYRSKSVSQSVSQSGDWGISGVSMAYLSRTFGVLCNSFVLSGINFIFAQREQIP